MNVRNRMAQRGIALHHALRYYNGFVRRIIQHLDIELVLGIIDLADRLHQSVDYELLVVNRELDGDAGKLGKLSKRLRGPVLAVAVVHVNQRIAVHSVRGQNHHHFKNNCLYNVSLLFGTNPASRIIRRSSSSVVQLVTPAERTTFSSSITEPTSLPPKRRPSWQTFSPWVTQLDCTFSKFERKSREMASTFRYSTAVASSQCRPPRAVFLGWKLQGINAVKPPVSSCNS